MLLAPGENVMSAEPLDVFSLWKIVMFSILILRPVCHSLSSIDLLCHREFSETLPMPINDVNCGYKLTTECFTVPKSTLSSVVLAL